MVRTRLRVPLIWLRHRGLAPNDIFLASFPRSGNTWTRFLLSEVLTGASADFRTIDRTVSEMGIHLKTRSVLPGGGRCIKTHEPYRREYQRAIYLVRDIRDVVLSEFAIESQMQLHCMSFDEYLLRFLAGETTGYGSWQEHVSNWTSCPLARTGDLLVVKFEELRRDPESVLARMTDFIGCAADAGRVQQAVRNNSIAAMRAREDAATNIAQNTPEDGRFVRTGSVGGWRGLLTPSQVQLVDQYAGAVLAEMGYERGAPRTAEREIMPTRTAACEGTDMHLQA